MGLIWEVCGLGSAWHFSSWQGVGLDDPIDLEALVQLPMLCTTSKASLNVQPRLN